MFSRFLGIGVVCLEKTSAKGSIPIQNGIYVDGQCLHPRHLNFLTTLDGAKMWDINQNIVSTFFFENVVSIMR